MRAVILAGGRGERLSPLTQTVPKPLVSFAGRPLVDHLLVLLARSGFTEVVFTLGYQGEKIRRHVGNGERFGVAAFYSSEDRPLGTAGSMRKALLQYPSTEPFLAIAGDAVTDLDLRAVYRRFHARGVALGLVSASAENPADFGIVIEDQNGDIMRFVEKPASVDGSWRINTGIYYLEPAVVSWVPADTPYDFGKQLFPLWLSAGRRIAGQRADGYWCDVGGVGQYAAAHGDALDGRVFLPLLPEARGGLRVAPGAQIDPAAILIPPVLVGEGAVIEGGAMVGPYAVVGARSRIEVWAQVRHSVLGEEDRIAASAVVDGSLLGRRVLVEGECRLGKLTTVGEYSRIGWASELYPGLRVPAWSDVPPETKLFDHQGDWWIPDPLGRSRLPGVAERAGRRPA